MGNFTYVYKKSCGDVLFIAISNWQGSFNSKHMKYEIRKLINIIRDCFGKNIYLFLDGIKICSISDKFLPWVGV